MASQTPHRIRALCHHLHRLPFPGLSTSHVFKYGEGKSPYRGVASRPIQGFSGGGGGGGGDVQPCLTIQISLKQSPADDKWKTSSIIREITYINLEKSGDFTEDTPENLEITDINLETGRYGSKSGVSRIIRESSQPCISVTEQRERPAALHFHFRTTPPCL